MQIIISCFSSNEQLKIYSFVFRNNIIKWNKDREEKTHLLDLKILELKKVFDSNNLDSLRNINFDFKEELKDINLNEQELKMVREGAE